MAAQRFSHQRQRILETVRQSREHPTAEMVYRQLKGELPRLSLGTVYRNLHQMAEEGILRELAEPVTRFDWNTAPHTHARCAACGRVADLGALPYDAGLDEQAAAGGWTVTGHTLTFTGLCPQCKGQQGAG